MNVFLKPVREFAGRLLNSKKLLLVFLLVGSSVYFLKGLYVQSGGDVFAPIERRNEVHDNF